MRAALFGIEYYPEYKEYYSLIFNRLKKRNIHLTVFKPFYKSIEHYFKNYDNLSTFSSYRSLKGRADVLLSFGGDGTILSSVTYVRDSKIPILGINLGNLGFLSSTSKEEIDEAINDLLNNNYILDRRTLLKLESDTGLFKDLNFALNEFSVHKKGNLSMITIHVYVNDDFLNSYWADGLIISTPTGSTGYSLSCSGPIVAPGSKNFIITPISTHNLTVRPVVIPDDSVIKLKVIGRNKEFMAGLDSRYVVFPASRELIISRCDFHVNLVRFARKNFFDTIREKLNWGMDKRN